MEQKQLEELIASAIALALQPIQAQIDEINKRQAEFEEKLRKTGRKDLSEAVTRLEAELANFRITPNDAPPEPAQEERQPFPEASNAGAKVRLYCAKYKGRGTHITDTSSGEITWQDGFAELPYGQARELYENQPSVELAL